MLSGGLNIDIDSLPETQKIYYTATGKVTPKSGIIGTVIANKYDNDTGEGVMCFNSDVIKIGSSAFESNKFLTSITIPNSVTEIGYCAFDGCSSLKSITIPDSVTSIGESAFYYCKSLASVTIPDSVTEIGDHAFYGCTSLTSVTIGNGVTSIGNYAFSDCTGELIINSKIVETDYTSSNYPSKYGWLIGSSFSSLTIGDSISKIGSHTFRNYTSLTSIAIPNSVTSINGYIFYECTSLTSVYITDIAVWCNISFGDSYSNPLCYAEKLYLNNELITDLTIPDNITSIGNYAFYNYDILTSITIPNSVTSIGKDAFWYCSNLTSITIPNSVTEIGEYAFRGCSSLTSVYCKPTTPPSLRGPYAYVFDNNASSRKIYVPAESVATYKNTEYWSEYKSAIVGYDFENGVVVIPKPANNEIWYTNGSTTEATTPYKTDAFGANIISNTYDTEKWCWVIKFDSDVTKIGDKAFWSCKLKTIIIPNSVTEIGNEAFHYCGSLTSVNIPDSVTTIRDTAFGNCNSLTSIAIPDSVTSIDSYAFHYCGSLTSVTIGNSVTTIGNSAFQDCSSLTSITIPDSVTSIGGGAFMKCSSLQKFNGKFASADGRCLIIDGVFTSFASAGLTEYTIPDGVTSIKNHAFYNCYSLTSINIPDSVTTIGYWTFYNCGLTSVTIPESVTEIGAHAFDSCHSLTSITIPNSVTSIENGAFEDCDSLTSVTIGNGVTSIGDRAFYECSSLTSITCYAPTAPSIQSNTFYNVLTAGTLYVPTGSDYISWMSTGDYYLGKYNWTIQYI